MIKILKYRCCFCNKMIEPNQINPCDLNILANIDKPKDRSENQSFYCHVECFKSCLHDYSKDLLIIDISEDE